MSSDCLPFSGTGFSGPALHLHHFVAERPLDQETEHLGGDLYWPRDLRQFTPLCIHFYLLLCQMVLLLALTPSEGPCES